MDNKKIILIAMIILVIATVVILVMLTTVNYERIEITPNGTSLEVPANQTKYDGEIEKAKIWNWDNGILVTYNSHEDKNILKVSEVGFNTLNNIIKNGEKQNIDGYTCYVINADELLEIHLFDIIKVNYNGKFYCIPLSNESSHDNLIICCNDKNIAVHMAKSVEYKNVFPDDSKLEDSISTVKNITGDLQSKANEYANSANLSQVKSEVEQKTGVNLDDAKSGIEQYIGKIPIRL
ncbi:hypothetical protein [Methanobrevibacter millerae]|uniref:Uncharacterized protein n=1 Tax=Methanobrevibacter millerae TaxID=230361 RepID=A0A1G5XLE1_9EURY|nr:hypothetical protein [Methanobrevibacter millerae]SDA71289.1 hypothetical protein SAMN02910315_02350 [Methanobrevibacter millerae]